MYLRKLNYKEDSSSKNHHSSEETGWKYLTGFIFFTLIILLSIILSSLSEAEIRVL